MTKTGLVVESRWTSDPVNVQHARESVRKVLSVVGDKADADLIELAVGEACANAVEHGSPSGVGNEFVLRCSVHPSASQIVFEVEDEGENTRIADLPLSSTPDLYAEHGRGLFLIRAIMDEVSICRSVRGLTVRMTKSLLVPMPA